MNVLVLILFLAAAACFFLDAVNVPHIEWIAVGLCLMAIAFAITFSGTTIK